MNIKINGKQQDVTAAGDLMSLIIERGLDPGTVVIEHNYTVVPREKWEQVGLVDGDNVEIVAFVGGG